MSKKTVGILYGGQSAEHEVSLKSAEALVKNLDREKYDPLFIFIDKNGYWQTVEEREFGKNRYLAPPGESFLPWNSNHLHHIDADIYFPMLHGPNGEDGKIQGLLEMAGKPYAGANSVASALAMDKVVAKILLQKAGLNVGDYIYFQNNHYPTIKTAVEEKLGYPVFVKPSFMGSSVGISRVDSQAQLKEALDLAFRYGGKIIIEKGLDIREIEVSVIGNDEIMVSRPGELIPHNQFYDYKDKYIDGKTTFHIPAQLDGDIEEQVRDIAGKAFKALFLNGMARVDLFLHESTNQIYVNELNTIPGFTEISMFPKLWTLDGISFTQLIDRLIDYGFQYFNRHNASTDWRG